MPRDESGLGAQAGGAALESRYMHVPFDSLSVPAIAEEIRSGETLAQGDPDVAVTHFRELVDRHPQSGDCWSALGGALDSSGRPDEAIPCYERALVLAPDAPWRRYTYLQLSSSYRNVGRLDDAKKLLEEGLELFPDLRALAVLLAFVEYDRGAYRSAVTTLFDLVVTVAPDTLQPYGRSMARYRDLL